MYADDIRVHDRILTREEILATYQAGRGGGLLYEPPRQKSYSAFTGSRRRRMLCRTY